jgi:N-methylhydantoinase A
MNWRVVVSGPRPSVSLRVQHEPKVHQNLLKGTRLAYFPEASGFLKTPVYDRYQMGQGLQFAGPAIVEERESTLVIGLDTECHVDDQWNLIVRMS